VKDGLYWVRTSDDRSWRPVRIRGHYIEVIGAAEDGPPIVEFKHPEWREIHPPTD
jgi:hypothetical protein